MIKIIAIDGYGGSGKTTFAKLLANELGAKVIHTDDYATDENPLNWWPEVIEKVLKPAKDDKENTGYLILEGVSSLRKEFRPYIDFGIFIDTPIDVCRERLCSRDNHDVHIKEKLEKWLVNEVDYTKRDNPSGYANLVIDGNVDFELSLRQLLSKLNLT